MSEGITNARSFFLLKTNQLPFKKTENLFIKVFFILIYTNKRGQILNKKSK